MSVRKMRPEPNHTMTHAFALHANRKTWKTTA